VIFLGNLPVQNEAVRIALSGNTKTLGDNFRAPQGRYSRSAVTERLFLGYGEKPNLGFERLPLGKWIPDCGLQPEMVSKPAPTVNAKAWSATSNEKVHRGNGADETYTICIDWG
jgi:hypothetical protein